MESHIFQKDLGFVANVYIHPVNQSPVAFVLTLEALSKRPLMIDGPMLFVVFGFLRSSLLILSS